MSEQPAVNASIDALLKKAVPERVDFENLVIVPVFAVVAALVLGTVAMLATNVGLATIGQSYVALLVGSLGSINALSETLSAATPLVLAGLGLALGFRAGMFNIGAEGQLLMGGMAAAIVGFSFPGLPLFVHLPLALLAGAVVGGLYAGIAGWLGRRAALTYLIGFGALYLGDGLLGMLTGSGYLDAGILIYGIQDSSLVFRLAANAPHLALGGVALLAGLVDRR